MPNCTDYALQVLSERQLRQRTVNSYLETIKYLGLSDAQVEELTFQFVWNKLQRITNPNTRRKHIIALKSIFSDFEWAKKLRIPKAQAKHYQLPSEDELRLALMMSPYELQGLLMMYAGLRPSEAVVIRPQDVVGRTLKVYRQRSEKTHELGPAKTTGDVIIPQWLADRVKGMTYHYINSAALRESIKYYGKKVGIHLTPGVLRHWYGTQLVNNKTHPKITQKQMRHSSLRTTLEYYAQVESQDVEGVIDELF